MMLDPKDSLSEELDKVISEEDDEFEESLDKEEETVLEKEDNIELDPPDEEDELEEEDEELLEQARVDRSKEFRKTRFPVLDKLTGVVLAEAMHKLEEELPDDDLYSAMILLKTKLLHMIKSVAQEAGSGFSWEEVEHRMGDVQRLWKGTSGN